VTRFLAITLLSACAFRAEQTPVGPDMNLAATELSLALEGSRPEPLLNWALDPHGLIDTNSGCPSITQSSVDGGLLEVWEGGCEQPDGTQIDGRLIWFDGPTSAWTSAEGFSVTGPDGLELALDGAVEITGEGALWLADATATACAGASCANPALSVDLAYTVFPAEGYPSDYDLTVSGVIAIVEESGAITIDGAWSIDESACAEEPIQGLVAVQSSNHQTLTLNGSDTCDDCAAWVVQGRDAPAYCGLFR